MALKSSTPGTNGFYNLITVILLVLTAIVACGAVYMISTMPPTVGYAGEPTLILFPTETPTLRGPTPNATLTPSPTPEATTVPTATRTVPPSITPTPTDTPTATNTMTPTLTATITPTRAPTNTPTRMPYDFALENNTVVLTANTPSVTGNNAGCAWSGIGGRVVEKSGAHITNMNVLISGGRSNWSRKPPTPKSPYYGGSSGWEYFLNNSPTTLNGETFTLWLEYSNGTRASQDYTFTTSTICNASQQQNLVLAVFVRQQLSQ